MSRAAHLKKPRRGFFARRTIRRALRVALAAFSAAPWQGFEKAERCPSLASLFPPQAAVGSAAVRIHPCNPFCKTDKTETPVPIGYRSSWWARVDYASRASKKAPQGLFCPPDHSAGRCCSNPPLKVKLEIPDKTKNQRIFYAGLFGGRGWIRTTEAESSRFTVCPHWPLGNTPIFIFVRPFA